MQSSQFADAVHVIVLLMHMRDERNGASITSHEMADSACANPVVIRRTLGELRQAGLVTSQPGPSGGWRLARDPAAITLGDIYRATNPAPVLALPRREGSPSCVVGAVIHETLRGFFTAAEGALERKLDEITADDVLNRILADLGPNLPANPLAACPRAVSV